MAGFFKKLSLVPAGLRYKLMIAFVLMSVIPLAISVYLACNYIFPVLETPWDLNVILADISGLIGITILIALLGFKIARDIVSPIIDMALKAKDIAKGDLTGMIDIKREDEIGELGSALNVLTRRIRENMDELRSYSEKTKEINVEIGKKVFILSGLLQIGNLISQGSPIETVLNLIVQKITQMSEDENTVFLMLSDDRGELTMGFHHNLKKEELKELKLKVGTGFIGSIVSEKKPVIIDKRSKMNREFEDFLGMFQIRNCVLAPVTAHGEGFGIVCFGNFTSDFEFMDEDVDLLKLFTKQIAIAVENEMLTKKAKDLTIRDELTGLYNEKFIINRLAEEIKRATLYQRPCAFVIFNIDDIGKYRQANGGLAAEETIKKIGKIIEANITEIDRVGRLGGDEFAAVLPEKNKKQANALAEVLRQRVEASGIVGGNGYPRKFVTVSGGVSENPIDGVTADDLVKKAGSTLQEAKQRGKNVVVS